MRLSERGAEGCVWIPLGYPRGVRPTLLALTVALVPACSPALTTVYLVRHAEKAADPGDGDPPLTEAGQARARALALTLADVPLAAVYTTDLKRTRETLAPLAAAQGLEPRVLPAADTARLVEALAATSAGARVLVVGHSNTLPEVLAALGVDGVDVQHGDYDDLFVLVLGGAAPELARLHYGAVAREPAPQ